LEKQKEKPSNVVKFPKVNTNYAATASLEEMKAEAEKNRVEFVNYMSGELIEELFFKMQVLGFEFDDDKYMKDCVMVSESLKSLILKSLNVHHGLQDAAEKLIDIQSYLEDA